MDGPGYNAGIHGCQVHRLITVQGMVTGDFIRFGSPFYDGRQRNVQGCCGIGRGKEDASGKLILIKKAAVFTKKPSWGQSFIFITGTCCR